MENGASKSDDNNIGTKRNLANGGAETIPRSLTPKQGHSKNRHFPQTVGRKLVLHFDVRNTILVADSVDNISVEQALNSFLTGVTWGRDSPAGWQWSSSEPSLTSPLKDTITYYKHLEAQVVKVPSDRAKLRRMTGNFTQEPIGCKFAPYFWKHLKHLEWKYKSKGSSDKKLTMKGLDGKLYHYILPSFYKLIHHLSQNNRDFCIVIRTYGLDAHNVLKSIKFTMDGNHPQFPEPLPISVNTTSGVIHRKADSISLEVPTSDINNPAQHLTDEREIYDFLTNTTGICAFVDDFRFWQDNGYDHSSAKPLWLDTNQQNVQHIFFDDNIRISDEDSIVDVRVFDDTSGEARSLDQHEMATLEDVGLVQANLLESTSNTDYFIDKVNACERNFDKVLKTLSRR